MFFILRNNQISLYNTEKNQVFIQNYTVYVYLISNFTKGNNNILIVEFNNFVMKSFINKYILKKT